MSDSSEPKAIVEDQTAPTTSTNTGVDIDAQRDVAIGGDVVGRDKITQNTWSYIRQVVLQPWALIGGMVILVIGLIAAAGLFNITPIRSLLPTPVPSPTPLAFATASPQQSLIIVTDFVDRSGGSVTGLDPAQYVFDALQDRIARDRLEVRVQHLHEVIDDTAARSVGEVYSATLVLWGWYDATGISPRLERIKRQSDYRPTAEGQPLMLAEPDRVQFDVVNDLQSQATYLTLFALGVDRYSGGDFAKALPYFNSALAVLPPSSLTSTQRAEGYFFRGNTYYHQSDYVRARADYSQTLEIQPGNVLALNNRANANDALHEHAQALADYDLAIDLQPTEPMLFLNRSLCHMNLEQIDAAQDDLDQALNLQSDDGSAYLARGTLKSLHRGDFDGAIADYTRAIDLQPNLGLAYVGRAMAYQAKGDSTNAKADLDQAARLGVAAADNDLLRGEQYMLQAKYDQAIEAFANYVKSAPGNIMGYYWLGQAYASRANLFYISGKAATEKMDDQTRRDYDQAIDNFNVVLKRSPNFVEALYGRGAAYGCRLDAEAALTDYNRVLELDPNYMMAYFGRSNVYLSRNDIAQAVADLKKALELSKDRPFMQQQIKAMLKMLEDN